MPDLGQLFGELQKQANAMGPQVGWRVRRWLSSPTNGVFFLSLKQQVSATPSLTDRDRADMTWGLKQLLGNTGDDSARLNFQMEGGLTLFSNGIWSYGFADKYDGNIVAGALMAKKLLSNATKDLAALLINVNLPDIGGTRETSLVPELVRRYFGYRTQEYYAYLLECFNKLLMVAEGALINGKCIMLYSWPGGSDQARTFGGVLPSDNTRLGWALEAKFKCIYLTEYALSGDDRNQIRIQPDAFLATTIVHELTHCRLKTDDCRTNGGAFAYGRQNCAVLTEQFRRSKDQGMNPLKNADSLAYFALDLWLLRKNLVSIEALREALLDYDI